MLGLPRGRSLVAIVILALSGHVATGAEIAAQKPEFFPPNKAEFFPLSIFIEGEIVEGDYSKLVAALNQARAMAIDGQAIFPISIALRSPGGDLSESMRIGSLVRELYLQTSAPNWTFLDGDRPCQLVRGHGLDFKKEECVCLSACFFIWAAGVERYPGEFLHWPSGQRTSIERSTLGMHRARFVDDEFPSLGAEEAEQRYKLALEVIEEYFREMDIPLSLQEKMTLTGSDEIYFLTKDEMEVLRHPPATEEWLTSRCGKWSKEDQELFVELIERGESRSPAEQIAYKSLAEKALPIFQCRTNSIAREQAKRLSEMP